MQTIHFPPLNAYYLICFLPIPIIALMMLVNAIGNSVEGYEDETGFHVLSSGSLTNRKALD